MIKSNYIKWEDLRKTVEEFRTGCARDMIEVPVAILEYVELDLRIEIIPVLNLERDFNIDGFLFINPKKLYIDEMIYYDERYLNRLRFTLAHELGHMVLHREQIDAYQFKSLEEGLKIREQISDESLKWFELQAYEFAGRLLVPRERLLQEVQKDKEKIDQYIELMGDDNIDELADYLSPRISKVFQVSEQVISKRLRTEKILDHFQQ